MRKWLLFSFLLISTPAFADVVSLSSNYVEGQADVTSKLNDDRQKLVDGVNNVRGVYAGSVQSAGQIKADTIGEENMADDANPRVRTSEGASCPDLVYTGLLPSTTSGTLVGSVPSGVAYPDGYRIEKSGSTAKTFAADKWTYGYLLTSGSLSYQEQTIGGSRPSDPANSAPLFRASTNSTEVIAVQDLRKTSCSSGPFSAIADAAGEATLADLFSNGTPVKTDGNEGFLQGLAVSWASHTTFTVSPGAAYINGKYRVLTDAVTVTQSADDPASGSSGVDTSVSSSTRYNIFAVADKESDEVLSITYSSGASPAGVTNARKIGEISTDGSSLFSSHSTNTVNGVMRKEISGGWVNFNGSTMAIGSAHNVSSLTDHGAGDYTVTWDADYQNANYVVVAGGGILSGNANSAHASAKAVGSVRITFSDSGGSAQDTSDINVLSFGTGRS